MRTPLVTIALLVSQTVVVGEALACRGWFRSTSEIVRASSSIFTAKIIRRVPTKQKYVIELRVTEVLKGSVPESLTVNGNVLIHPNDNCFAIESGELFPSVGAGEVWLISGNFDTNRELVPTIAGNFRLVYADGTADEGRNHLLSEFRETIFRMRKKSGELLNKPPAT